ncbi:MAG: UDP-N-acetylmuramate dehydrogenase [Syntrophotaleaceae bacterium]
MTNRLFDKLQQTLRGQVAIAEPLAKHTTWRIGGPADLFLRPLDVADLVNALSLLRSHGTPWLAIGSGSNLLMRDGGFRGAIIHLGHFRDAVFDESARVRAGAGLGLMRLIRLAVERGLGGLEPLAGIPGTVGGAVAMNAGAMGREIGSLVDSVLLAGADGIEEWPADRLAFGYRRSTLPPGRVISGVKLQLQPGNRETLQQDVAVRLRHRRTAQGVGRPNAGSVFKNPPGESAWKLVDQAGMRGARAGQAQVSELHGNFIVNLGGATAEDVLTLIDLVRDRVEEMTGIRLETEVRIVGSPKDL